MTYTLSTYLYIAFTYKPKIVPIVTNNLNSYRLPRFISSWHAELQHTFNFALRNKKWTGIWFFISGLFPPNFKVHTYANFSPSM
jgi:hypothetical protein